MYSDNWHMGGMMALWWILILVAIVAVIWLALAAPGRSSQSRDTPEQVLKHRYASNEIDRNTYERMLQDLRK
jgi:uncharacterized membrane protein